MKKFLARITAAVLVTVSCIMLFSGCQSNASSVSLSDITGTWVRTWSDMETTFTFKSDYTFEENVTATSGISMDSSGTFELKGDEIILHDDSFDYEFSYKVSIVGSTMYWDNGSAQLEYKKK